MYDANKDGKLSEEEIKPHVDKMKRKLREQLTMAKRTHFGMFGLIFHTKVVLHTQWLLKYFHAFLDNGSRKEGSTRRRPEAGRGQGQRRETKLSPRERKRARALQTALARLNDCKKGSSDVSCVSNEKVCGQYM